MRKFLIMLTATLTTGVVGGALAPGASALTEATCVGVSTVTYSPPLTNTLRPTTTTDQSSFAPCVSVTHPLILSATIANAAVTLPSSCTIAGPFGGTFVIHWNTGQTSTVPYTAVVALADGQVVLTFVGSVTAGLFAGADVTVETVLLGDLSACLGAGLSSNSGPTTLTVTGL